ncbi:uncharacterized protein LOC126675460 isoform X2 [Mercurialis annua]|uniref:uncharacterized protein LOC126675460 isoform X2 n=1 Tax=Mercurialis annua TaxID=3986 RepID=UPI002160A3E4|nr:uncharacterized protein LOC126675460 isoform X2 [Mercurialis annua]
MATSAFKSTTKRPSIGKSTIAEDSSSSSYSSSNRSNNTSAHRRSRSLSRFSRPILTDDFSDEPPAPRGRFVNTKRGSAFPADVTLDDLAVKFFNSGDRGRSVTKNYDDDGRVGDSNNKGNASQRRGRSVSRRVGGEGAGNSYGGGGRRLSSDNSSRRQRSVSVVRYQISDSESDLDHHRNSSSCVTSRNFGGGVMQVPLSSKTAASNHPKGLRRSLSQKDLKYHDGYSSHSSVLTDDEGRDAHSNVNGIERTIRAVYSQKKGEHPSSENINSGMYEAMRKELRNAVEEIKMELEQASRKSTGDDCFQEKSTDALQTVSTIRRNYANKLEVSEKRKQDLLAEILLEEQRGRELSKMVKELLPEPKNNIVEKPFRTRKSNDRNRMSKRLTEEAEKYFEDFISNVEDTDISSLDGEMTDTSSSLGGITKTQIFRSPAMSKPATVEMDGVVLPWLQWETSNDTPFVSKKTELMGTPKIHLRESTQEASPVRDLSNHSVSSHGSWSPGLSDGHSATVNGNRFVGEYGNSGSQTSSGGTKFDIDDYLERQSEEDFIFERWNQQQRIHSGSIVICSQMFF